MDRLQFKGEIRHWRPERAAGLAVVDIPADMVAPLGGLETGAGPRDDSTLPRSSPSTMPAGGGRLALSVSKAMMSAAGVSVGQTAAFEISATGHR